jgi:hypothetical protein
MIIRPLTKADIPEWLTLAHESDAVIARMVPDIKVFYHGFDEYMERKIAQQEAFMATDIISRKCLGVIAFSKNDNRISFIGITEKTANFTAVGQKMLEFALKQLDNSQEINAGVIKANAPIFKQERALYRSFGFTETNDTIMENGVAAIRCKRSPGQKAEMK